MRAGRHEAAIRINIYRGYRKGLVANESHKAKRKSKTNRAKALFVLYMGWHLLCLPREPVGASTNEATEQSDRQAKASMP
ncbi:hypothetical protein [Treponema endosymbiont of Eucomonympha sp.]|uniref:hypothetical protein n=1 Tax=Treponema endosymbiont of Eucomonympha sp. TaxID=1580831 RepID=UPI000750ACC4|nr:hypothetical protein [Treponema endosymbiont of Eucomonympha sp.]